MPVDVKARSGGKSKIHLWDDGLRFILLILRMIMLYDPLRIFLPMSVSLAGLGFLAWVLGIWNEARLMVPNSTIFLFIASLLVFLLGLVSSQLSALSVGYFGDESVLLEDAEQGISLKRGLDD